MAPTKDLLFSRRTTVLAYGIPTTATVLVGSLGGSESLLTAVWALGFMVMGVVCVVNAMRCGRIHCYFTGPFLLLIAAASLIHGLGVVSLGPGGWQWLGLVAAAGAAALLIVPERLWGRYASRARRVGS